MHHFAAVAKFWWKFSCFIKRKIPPPKKKRYESFFGYPKHLWTVNEIERKIKVKNEETFVSSYLILLNSCGNFRTCTSFGSFSSPWKWAFFCLQHNSKKYKVTKDIIIKEKKIKIMKRSHSFDAFPTERTNRP